MLAELLPGLLPELDRESALEVTTVHSVAGALRPADGGSPLLTVPPFQAPHHTASVPAIVGGGSAHVRPGAASLAHRGVLFLVGAQKRNVLWSRCAGRPVADPHGCGVRPPD